MEIGEFLEYILVPKYTSTQNHSAPIGQAKFLAQKLHHNLSCGKYVLDCIQYTLERGRPRAQHVMRVSCWGLHISPRGMHTAFM